MIALAAILAVALSGGNNNPPPPHAAPAPAPVHVAPARGFSLPHDVPQRPAAPQPHAVVAPRPVQRPVQPMPRYQPRPPAAGPRITNPSHWSQPWQWNNGVAWIGAQNYWGWGFWGPWAFGLSGYFVEPDSPGAELLQEYGLTQTPCGPPNLVEIFGPDGSEICAFPNQLVAPGQYSLDPTTLTLISYGPNS
jgi:hypothetical protein